MKPLITFIIPVYNGSGVIEPCLRSIFLLKEERIEVIVVDDGSEDSSLLQEKLKQFPAVRYLRQENGGVSSARNTGIRNAKGAYLTFIDADDCILTERYDEVLRQIQAVRSAADVYMFGYVIENGGKQSEAYPCLDEGNYQAEGIQELQRRLLDNRYAKRQDSNYIGGKVYQYIVKRELFEDGELVFPYGIHYAEDLCYCLRLLSKCKEITVIHQLAYQYSVNPGSASHRLRENYWEELLTVWNEVSRIPGTEFALQKLYFSYAKEACRHYLAYIKGTRELVAHIAPILDDKVIDALDSIAFDDWTWKERIENTLIRRKAAGLYILFERSVTCLKRMK